MNVCLSSKLFPRLLHENQRKNVQLASQVKREIQQTHKVFSLTDSEKKILESMIRRENESRLSKEGQILYKNHDYETATEMIRLQVIQDVELDPKIWLSRLHNGALYLGLESTKLANYIAGSYAAIPEQKCKMGDVCPNSVQISSLAAEKVMLTTLLKKSPLTILIAGSSS